MKYVIYHDLDDLDHHLSEVYSVPQNEVSGGEARRVGKNRCGTILSHFWCVVGLVVFFDLFLRALVLLAGVERPFYNPSLHLRFHMR